MASSDIKPPFAHRAFIICFDADTVQLRGGKPDTPHLDMITLRGVSTGIMAQASEGRINEFSSAQELFKQVGNTLPSLIKWTENVPQMPKAEMRARLQDIWDAGTARLVIINASEDVEVAESAADMLLRLTAPAPGGEDQMGKDMMGVLSCGSVLWRPCFSEIQFSGSQHGFPVPRQSWTLDIHGCTVEDVDSYSPAGIFILTGFGLARKDDRMALFQRSVRPGEGFLRIQQIAWELVAKLGAIAKFGA